MGIDDRDSLPQVSQSHALMEPTATAAPQNPALHDIQPYATQAPMPLDTSVIETDPEGMEGDQDETEQEGIDTEHDGMIKMLMNSIFEML